MTFHVFLIIVDDHTKFVWTFPMINKYDTGFLIKNIYNFVLTQISIKIKSIRSDNRVEFLMTSFHDSLEIIHETLYVDTPQLTSTVERKHFMEHYL